MTRRRLPLLLAAVGALIIIASIIAAAVVRSSDTATLSLGERPDVPVVVTEPGILDAVDPQVTVRATADDDEPVVLAIGRTSEVEAWLGDVAHARITGLSSWEELTVDVVTGAGSPTDEPTDAVTDLPTDAASEAPTAAEPTDEAATLPNPAGSDLWVVETVGTGSAELSWTDTPGRWSLMAATDGSGPAPEIELEWGRQVSTPWLVPGIILGAIALVAGVTMLVLDALAKREQRRRDEARARREAGEDDGPQLSISDTDPGTGERFTRRQIREMERAMAHADRSRRAGEPVPPPIPLAHDDDSGDHATTVLQDDGESTDPAAEQPLAGGEPAATAEQVHDDVAPAEAQEPVTDEPGAERAPAASPPQGESPPEATESAAEDTPAPAPTSWRSVWGFGGTTVGRAEHETSQPTDQHDDGEERR